MNEIAINASLCVTDQTSPTDALQTGETTASLTNDNRVHLKITIPTTLTAVPVTGLVLPGWAMFVNHDTTNYVDLYSSLAGTRFARVPAGLSCGPLLLSPDQLAPYARANAAACVIEILIQDT